MEQKDVRFYKLDKSKRYGVEGAYIIDKIYLP